MSDVNKKGPLIQKKAKPNTLERPRPVIINSPNDFKFDSGEKTVPTPLIKKTPRVTNKKQTKPQSTTEVASRKVKSMVGKNDAVKSIKVPHELHTQIGVLGKFMDEVKTYAILSTLVDYYVKGELTDRQKKQFEYMTDFFHEENPKD